MSEVRRFRRDARFGTHRAFFPPSPDDRIRYLEEEVARMRDALFSYRDELTALSEAVFPNKVLTFFSAPRQPD